MLSALGDQTSSYSIQFVSYLPSYYYARVVKMIDQCGDASKNEFGDWMKFCVPKFNYR